MTSSLRLGGQSITPPLRDRPALATGGGLIDAFTRFGVRGDNSTPNATALMAMNAALRGSTALQTIILPAGTILSDNTRWPFGLLNVSLTGTGPSRTMMRSTSTDSPGSYRTYPLVFGVPYDTNTEAYAGTVVSLPGMRVNSIVTGDTSFTFATPSDGAACTPGMHLMFFTYEQVLSGGAPPGSRRAEWKKVDTVTGTPGAAGAVYNVDAPFENDHDTNTYDVPNYFGAGYSSGKPRVLLLDRADYTYPRQVNLELLTFGRDTHYLDGTAGGTGFMLVAADTLNVNNCGSEDNVWASMNRVANYTASDFGLCEFDKLCGTVTATSCNFLKGGVTGASGVQTLKLLTCNVTGPVMAGPRHMEVRNTHITGTDVNGSITLQPGKNPVSSYIVQNLTLNSTSGLGIAHLEYLDYSGSITVKSVSGNDMHLQWVGNYNDVPENAVLQSVGKGTILSNANGTKLGVCSKDPTLVGGDIILTVSAWTGRAPPVVGEVWKYRAIQGFQNLGGHTILDGNAFATFGGGGLTATFADFALIPAPVNSVAPTASSTAAVGTAVGGTDGTWTNSPDGYAYQWRYGDTGALISGATSATYTPVTGDISHTLIKRVFPLGSSAAGTVYADSNATAAVTAPVAWWDPDLKIDLDPYNTRYHDVVNSVDIAASDALQVANTAGNVLRITNGTGLLVDNNTNYDSVRAKAGSAFETALAGTGWSVIIKIKAGSVSGGQPIIAVSNSNMLLGWDSDTSVFCDFGTIGYFTCTIGGGKKFSTDDVTIAATVSSGGVSMCACGGTVASGSGTPSATRPLYFGGYIDGASHERSHRAHWCGGRAHQWRNWSRSRREGGNGNDRQQNASS